jgi:hypothetical protein
MNDKKIVIFFLLAFAGMILLVSSCKKQSQPQTTPPPTTQTSSGVHFMKSITVPFPSNVMNITVHNSTNVVIGTAHTSVSGFASYNTTTTICPTTATGTSWVFPSNNLYTVVLYDNSNTPLDSATFNVLSNGVMAIQSQFITMRTLVFANCTSNWADAKIGLCQ